MRRRWIVCGLVLLLAASVCAESDDPLRAEARRRNDRWVEEGFNFTHGFAVAADARAEVELLIPADDEELTIALWMASADGTVSAKLVGPGGEVEFELAGREVDETTHRTLPVGAHRFEIRATGAAARGVLGVRGPITHDCKTGAETAADPAKGFHWPYLLYRPAEIRDRHLLVAPNNSGFASRDPRLLRASASCEIERQRALADRLGAVLLVPIFPRPKSSDETGNLYLHALTRAALETREPELRRVDLQLLAMIDDVRGRLEAEGHPLDRRVLLRGFSASGSFVERFALLHPERVSAVACGSPGGWPTVPVTTDAGHELDYPVGVADLEKLTGEPIDRRAWKRVRWFFFLGAIDENDAVPYRDSFSAADEKLIDDAFGATPVARWPAAERLFRKAGLDVRFELYPGVAHMTTPAIDEDVAKFFAAAR